MGLPDAIEASTAVSVRSCLEQFAVCVSKLKGTQNAHIKNRHADFKLWVDSVGAIAQDRASLDWRFRDRPDDIFFILGLLEMLEWYLKECVAFAGSEETVAAVEDPKGHGASSIKTETFVDAVEDILSKTDSMVHNLISIGTTIRRSGRKSRLRKADASFERNKERYHDLRAHLACLLVSTPCQGERTLSDTDYFATLKLSPVQNRLIEANLRRRHRFMDAQRHSHLLKGSDSAVANRLPTPPLHAVVSAMVGTQGSIEGPQKPAVHVPVKSKREASDSGTKTHTMITPGTIASAPETSFQGLQHGGHTRSSVTRITAITAAAQYPRVKTSNIEQFSFKCPCCCQAIPTKEAEDSQYRKHLANDVCPYTCILDDCPTPYKLFVTEKEWNEHFMNTHPPRFQCPYCESPTMNSLAGIMSHIQIQHPKIPNAELADALAKSAVHVMGLTKCPLCDSEGSPDSPELIEHILEHIHNFSLRSLPWPKDPVPNLKKVAHTFNLKVEPYTIQWVDNLIPWEEAPPRGTRHLQLSRYDKSLEIEEDNASRQSKMDYFAQNDYFEDESSDGRFLSRSGQSYMSGSERRRTAASVASKDTISWPEFREVKPITSGLKASWSYDPELDGPSPTRIGKKPRVNAPRSEAQQTLEGHTGFVRSVAFSPDGKQVVSGSDDETVRLWDAATGVAQQTLEGHTGFVRSVAFSPDGKQVVSGSDDEKVRLWDAATGKAQQTLEGHTGFVSSVFSPDGKQVVSGSNDETVRLLDAATGEAQQTLEGHTGFVRSVLYLGRANMVNTGAGIIATEAMANLLLTPTETASYLSSQTKALDEATQAMNLQAAHHSNMIARNSIAAGMRASVIGRDEDLRAYQTTEDGDMTYHGPEITSTSTPKDGAPQPCGPLRNIIIGEGQGEGRVPQTLGR